MAGYTPDARVAVRPHSRRRDGDTATIGDIDRQVFLAIPAEGLDVLDWLAEGCTVGEAADRYRERFGEAPDLPDFLDALDQEGFLGDPDLTEPGASSAQAAKVVPDDAGLAHDHRHGRRGGHAHGHQGPMSRRWRMEWLSERAARRLVSAPVLIAGALLMAVAAACMIDNPGIIPQPRQALLFPIDFAVLTWCTVVLTVAAVALHEIGHVVAARAAGVPASIGIGNQLYVIVAQTDMSSIWLAPKRRRYVAFGIGAFIDGISVSVLEILLWLNAHGHIHLARPVVLLFSACGLAYFTRIVWQLFFFLRTDGYYAITTMFGCKSLLSDTEDFLRNQLARVLRSKRRIDQSGIPEREMRVVRWYSLLWLLGRFVAISVFLFAGVPIIWGYLYQVFLLLAGGHTRFGSFDFVTIAILTIAIDGGGLFVWVRGLLRGAARRAREGRAADSDAPVEGEIQTAPAA